LIQWLTYVTQTETEEKKKLILASILVLILPFLFTSFETPLKYKYYSLKDNIYYSNIDEFINSDHSINTNYSTNYNETNHPSIFNSLPKFLIVILSKLPSYFFLKSLLNMNRVVDLIQPKLDWMDDKWKEVGEKLGNEIWNSRKMVKEKKSEINLPISLHAYHASFPKFLTSFFDGVI
jgi:hypothetical protein